MSTSFLDLPPDVVTEIARWCDPLTRARLASTSLAVANRILRDVIPSVVVSLPKEWGSGLPQPGPDGEDVRHSGVVSVTFGEQRETAADSAAASVLLKGMDAVMLCWELVGLDAILCWREAYETYFESEQCQTAQSRPYRTVLDRMAAVDKAHQQFVKERVSPFVWKRFRFVYAFAAPGLLHLQRERMYVTTMYGIAYRGALEPAVRSLLRPSQIARYRTAVDVTAAESDTGIGIGTSEFQLADECIALLLRNPELGARRPVVPQPRAAAATGPVARGSRPAAMPSSEAPRRPTASGAHAAARGQAAASFVGPSAATRTGAPAARAPAAPVAKTAPKSGAKKTASSSS